jgi:hypothetical protein
MRTVISAALCVLIAASILPGLSTQAQDRIPCEPSDPTWGPVIQWLPEVLAAQEQVADETSLTVPANVILAMIMIETQGVMPDSAAYSGAAGLMQITPMSLGASGYDFERASVEPAYSIYIGVKELALRHNDSKRFNTEDPGQPLPWANIIVGMFSGHYFPTGAADAYNDDYSYQQMFIQYVDELEAACQTGGAPANASPVTGTPIASGDEWLAAVGMSIAGLAYLWGGDEHAPITQEFGPTDFSVNVHPEWYAFSVDYGFPEPGHMGIDIGLPAGTPLYAPTDAVVYCAGTFNPGFPEEEACAAFADVTGASTSGRLQLKLPNGDMLIYGNVRQTVVAPGSNVVKCQLVGYSGSQNGDHLHLEYRVRDSSLPAGWRIVDPRLTGLNGIAVST